IQAHDPHAVSMAALALSISSPKPKPPLIASRRVEFRIAHHSFSRWKYVHVELYLPTHAPIVGNVAALVPHKGQQHLIDAAAIVVKQVPDVRFVVLGEGELREKLERQIKEKHLERHVFLAGFRANALELTKGFDIFAMSSVSEGMCTALVDAMAASKPAVATAAGGIPEVMQDGVTGFLTQPRDHVTMAEKLVVLPKDPALRARMGEAALARALERFTVEKMV